ncbi:ATP-binding protein [Parasalinivibrio latis]|uniref:LuxQ periplasmic sensor domain-containing protein n=1 Tax=Parasalinivibrio latis TaxID=2952610 RepID=UPI0030DDE113
MTNKQVFKKRSLANWLVRLLFLSFSLITVGVMLQSYQYGITGINQEINRSMEQTSHLIQNLINYKLASIQNRQNINTASDQLQHFVEEQQAARLDQFFLTLEQQNPISSPDLRFITKGRDLLWHDGNSYFHGIDEPRLRRLIEESTFSNDWLFETVQTEMGERALLVRRTPIIINKTGQIEGQLYVALVLNSNFSFAKTLQNASNTDAVVLVNDGHILASSLHITDPLYQDIVTHVSDPGTAIKGYLTITTPLVIDGVKSPVSIISVQSNKTIQILKKQFAAGLLVSALLIMLLAVTVSRVAKVKVTEALQSLMTYTRSATTKTRINSFQGSEITEFDHIGQTLKLTLNELVEKEQYLEDLFNYAISPIVVWNNQKQITRINPAAQKHLGYVVPLSASEIIDEVLPGEAFQEFETRIRPYLRRILDGEVLRGINLRLNNKVYRWNLAPMEVNGEVHSIIGQGQDITSLIQAEKQSRKAQLSAEASAQAKADFLAKMSHEIRTPLNGILGITQLLQSSVTSEREKELVDILYQSGEHLLSVLNDVLDFSRIEQGKFKIEVSTFVLKDVISTVSNVYDPVCKSKGIDLVLKSDVPAGLAIRSDKARLTQILFNLLSNAVKFTHFGHISVEVAIKKQESGKPVLHVVVEDTGIGISEASQKQLFQPFVQADSTSTREYGGSGLGLAIVKSLLELLSGSINVASEPGKGSRFSFQFPVEVAEDESLPILPKPKNTLQMFEEPLSVLLVEDNRTNAMVAQAFCQKYGLQVQWVTDGLQALKLVAKSSYDLILMDNQMPNLGGIDTTKIIRHELKLDTPIFAFTADAQEATRDAFFNAGANYVIVKPIKETTFYEALLFLKGHKEKQRINA